MRKQSQKITDRSEKLLTIKQAALTLNVPYRQLLLAVQAGGIPAYRVGKSRMMVFASEVLSSICINTSKEDNHVE